MNPHLACLLAIATYIAPIRSVLAQQWTPPISTGTRVRVSANSLSTPVLGLYIGVLRDSLRVSIASGSATVVMPVRDVAWIDASEGRARSDALRIGMLGGLLAGGVIGAWIGVRTDPSGAGGLLGAAGLLIGGVLGAAGGGLAGALWAPERWIRYVNPGR